jgi:threonine dehydrogenase-like Zn-dependent dehydrogenase
MLALQKTRAEAGVELVDVPHPVPAHADEVRVRVLATGICGSDLHVDDWTPSYAFITPALPVTLGHEFVGIAEAGPLAGQRVVVRPSVTCGTCVACSTGRFDACEQRTGIGMTRQGAFADTVVVPLRNCVPVPPGLPDRLAALAEPLSISMQALRIGGDLAGRRVLVMGPGTIGQGIALLARRAGAAQVVVSGFEDAARLDALRRMGFDQLVDVAQQPLDQGCTRFTGGEPFDIVFEATGVPRTVNEALALLRRNGIVVVTGIHAAPLALDLTALVRRQLQLRGSFRPPESDWPEALALMAEIGRDDGADGQPRVAAAPGAGRLCAGTRQAGQQGAAVPRGLRMTPPAQALLALWNDADPAHDGEYNDWHAFEHVPERLTMPGFVWASRWRAQDDHGRGPRYLTLYGLESLAALESPAYRRLLAGPTPWSQRMRPRLRHLSRWACAITTDGGAAAGPRMHAVCLEDAPTHAGHLQDTAALVARRRHDAAPLPWLAGAQAMEVPGNWLVCTDVDHTLPGAAYQSGFVRLPVGRDDSAGTSR